MNRFAWLLKREWMQHHRGWLILGIAPLVLVLLFLPFGSIQFGSDERVPPPGALAALVLSIYMSGVMLIAGGSVFFQAGGMARRDQQDRSIEFWVSLPTSHWQSVLAMVLMHVLLMPLMVLGLAFVGAQLVAMGLVARLAGVAAVGSVIDPAWLAFGALALLRMVVGVVMSALWLSAVLMCVMASAAWLKGWGVPAAAAAAGVLALAVHQLSGSWIVWETVSTWFSRSTHELMPLLSGQGTLNTALKSGAGLVDLRAWMWGDTLRLLHDAVDPAFVAAIVLAVPFFGLLVLQRAGASGLGFASARKPA